MLLLLPLALASEPRTAVSAGAFTGVGPAGAVPSLIEGATVGISVQLGDLDRQGVGLAFQVREGLGSAALRTVSGLYGGVRWPGHPGPYLGLAFAHHHETAWELAMENPVGTSLATLPGITHRTGFEVAAGWDPPGPWSDQGAGARIRPHAQLSAVVLPGTAGPPVYAVLELGARIGLGGGEESVQGGR